MHQQIVLPKNKLPGAINVALADGYSKMVPLEALWGLYWHAQWTAPPFRPGG
jgi:hypothetical protein